MRGRAGGRELWILPCISPKERQREGQKMNVLYSKCAQMLPSIKRTHLLNSFNKHLLSARSWSGRSGKEEEEGEERVDGNPNQRKKRL